MSDSTSPKRNRCLAHGSVCMGNVLFGAGNVVAQIGLGGINPIVFAFIREGFSGPLLFFAGLFCLPRGSMKVAREDVGRMIAAGLSVFGMNFFFIMGVKLAGSSTAAIWQPAQPIIATCLAVILRLEHATCLKVMGIVVACTGCVVYSVLDADAGSAPSTALEGNAALLLQGFSGSCFYIAQKPLLKKYATICVLAYSYFTATVVMGVIAVVVNATPAVLNFICEDCHGDGWRVTSDAIFGIAYWVLIGSMISYTLIAWGNKHIDISCVTVYAVVQPVATTAVAIMVIAMTPAPHYGLRGFAMSDLCALVIFVGLGLVLHDSYSAVKLSLLEGGEGAASVLASSVVVTDQNYATLSFCA